MDQQQPGRAPLTVFNAECRHVVGNQWSGRLGDLTVGVHHDARKLAITWSVELRQGPIPVALGYGTTLRDAEDEVVLTLRTSLRVTQHALDTVLGARGCCGEYETGSGQHGDECDAEDRIDGALGVGA